MSSSSSSVTDTGYARPRHAIAGLFAALGLVLGGAVVAATQADAYSVSASAWRNSVTIQGETFYRSSASATTLVDAKIRAKLVRNWGPDYTSAWTSKTGTIVRTDYYTCWQGCSAKFENG